MANVISVKRRKEVKITKNARGDGVIKIDSEAVDILEKFLSKAEGNLSVKDLASTMIKYASDDTVIRIQEDDDGES